MFFVVSYSAEDLHRISYSALPNLDSVQYAAAPIPENADELSKTKAQIPISCLANFFFSKDEKGYVNPSDRPNRNSYAAPTDDLQF